MTHNGRAPGETEPRALSLCALEKEQAFKHGNARGINFRTCTACDGVHFLRDMVIDAWLASADAPVGHPMVNVHDFESGKVRATRACWRGLDRQEWNRG